MWIYFLLNIPVFIWDNDDIVAKIQQANLIGGEPDLNGALQTILNDVWTLSSDEKLKFMFILVEGSSVPTVTFKIKF